MNNIIRRTWRQGSMVNIEDLRGLAFQAEENGHTFEISAIDLDGEPMELSGTPAGTMLRPDNTDQTLTCSVSGGKVYATLPDECYDVPGRAGITIFLTSDNQTVAIYAAVVSVTRTQSGTAAPGTTADVVDLVNAINAAIAGIPATDTAIKAAMAPTYSNSSLYAVGSYAWYNGTLYRCTTAITTAETWTSGHWTAAALGNDLCDLKSALFKYGLEYTTFQYNYSGGQDFPFNFVVGNVYRFVHISGETITLSTKSGSSIAETIASNLATGQEVTFVPSVQADKFRMYCNSAGANEILMLYGEVANQRYDNVLDSFNIFDGTYSDEIYVATAYSKVLPATGNTARCAIVPISTNTDYIVMSDNNDRFRVLLANYEWKEGMTEIQGYLAVNDDTSHGATFNSGNYSFAYIQVSNKSIDCSLYVLAKGTMLDRCSDALNPDNLSQKSVISRNIELIKTVSDSESYAGKIVVNTNTSRVEAITSSAKYSTFEVSVSPGHKYILEFKDVPSILRIGLTKTRYSSGNLDCDIVCGNVPQNFNGKCTFVSGSNSYAYITCYNGTEFYPTVKVYETDGNLYAFGDMITGANNITVKNFGAVGDGTTDDTESLEQAMEYCFLNGIPVIFPQGTYMIRRPLTLKSHMEIYGLGYATVKKKASSTTTLTQALAENGTTLHVASVSGFEIGDYLLISNDASGTPAARYCSVGYITAIDSENLTITFKSAYDGIKTGAIHSHVVGCYVTNSCAIFRSWGPLYDCEYAYIHDITLDGNRVNGEFGEWCNGCIHLDASQASTVGGIPYGKKGNHLTVENVTIMNSPFDGISDQGTGGGMFENCVIVNPYMHGIHFGTNYKSANVLSNEIKETVNGAGVFWCSNVYDIVVQGNRFYDCHKGCSDYEEGSDAQNSIVADNVFYNIANYVFDFGLSYGAKESAGKIIINGNIIDKVNYAIARFAKKKNISVTNNIITNFATVPANLFEITNSNDMSFVGNIAYGASGIFSNTPEHFVNIGNSWN